MLKQECASAGSLEVVLGNLTEFTWSSSLFAILLLAELSKSTWKRYTMRTRSSTVLKSPCAKTQSFDSTNDKMTLTAPVSWLSLEITEGP